MPQGLIPAGSAPNARVALCAALLHAPATPLLIRTGQCREDIADTLLRCVREDAIDFRQLDSGHADLVAQLPEQAWLALQQHAVDQGTAGITTLMLPACHADGTAVRRFAIRGWRVLPALEHLLLAGAAPAGDGAAGPPPASAAPVPAPRRATAIPGWEAPFRASDLNSLAPHARLLESRHLALHWMDSRARQHRTGTDTGHTASGPPDFRQLTWSGAHALFETSQFGNVLMHEMGQMAPGDARHFALLTPNHTYALELQVRTRAGGSSEYIVNFYDPDAMAMHERVVVDSAARLRHRPLNAWITESALNASFGTTGPRIGCLYKWVAREAGSPDNTAGGSLDIHVADEHRSSPSFLYWALVSGHADSVAASVGRTLALAPALDRETLFQRLAARPLQTAGLFAAMGEGRVNAVARYADAILSAPGNLLDPSARHALLKADRRGLHALAHAMMEGQAAAVACYTRAILEAPWGALLPEHRLDLLLAPGAHGSTSSPVPALHKVCTRNLLVVPDRDLLHRQHQAIYRHLREIVASDKLPESMKAAVCAAVHRKNFYTRVTAAQAAMKSGNAPAAAAMVAAVLEGSHGRKSAVFLLRHLGVGLENVLEALARSSPQGLPWAPRILASLQESGLPASQVGKLLRNFGPAVGMRRIGERWRVVAAAPGQRRRPGAPGPFPSAPDDAGPARENFTDTRVS